MSGLLGGSGKFQPVPWSAVRFDPIASHFVVAMDKTAFKASPAYGWQEQSIRYFAETSAPFA